MPKKSLIIRGKKRVVLRLKPNYNQLFKSYPRLVTQMVHVTKHFISEESAITIWLIFRGLFMICLSLSDVVLTKVQGEKKQQNITHVLVANYLNQVNTKKLKDIMNQLSKTTHQIQIIYITVVLLNLVLIKRRKQSWIIKKHQKISRAVQISKININVNSIQEFVYVGKEGQQIVSLI